MNPTDLITETSIITIEWATSAGVNLTTTTTATGTYSTTGYIFIPTPFSLFDPIALLAAFLIFMIVGTSMGKPTSFLIAWFALSVLGVFSHGSGYLAYTLITLMACFMAFRFLKKTRQS